MSVPEVIWAPDEPDVYKIEFENEFKVENPEILCIEIPLPRGIFRVRVIVETNEPPQE